MLLSLNSKVPLFSSLSHWNNLQKPFSQTDAPKKEIKILVLAGKSNSTMTLHTAKTVLKSFWQQKGILKQDNHFQPSQWNRKARRETQGKNFFPQSISPRPTKEWVCNPCTSLTDDGQEHRAADTPSASPRSVLLYPLLWELHFWYDSNTPG